jgi:DNA-binding CsgD family transcriptional regulator
MKEEDFDRLVGLIYDSALDPGLWQETMRNLANQMEADTFHLLGWNSQEQAVTLGVVDASWNNGVDLYNHHYGSINPCRELATQAGHGVVIAGHHLFDDKFISKSEFYQDLWLKHGLRYVMGGCLVRTDTTDVVLGLMRGPERGHYTPEQEAVMVRLMPHFNRSLRLMEHTQATTRSGELAAAGQNAASLAVIAVNKLGQLLYCNRNGEALLKAAETVRIRHGVLTCANESEEKGWNDILALIVKTGRPANLLLNNSVKPDERYSVTLTPLPKRDAFALAGEPDGVLCLIVPLDHRRMATAGQLMQLFGLTAAEARLARALAAGDTLEFYAAESDLKLPTVKSQLRSVFEKTGADRQAALVRLTAGIPAVREPD